MIFLLPGVGPAKRQMYVFFSKRMISEIMILCWTEPVYDNGNPFRKTSLIVTGFWIIKTSSQSTRAQKQNEKLDSSLLAQLNQTKRILVLLQWGYGCDC